MEDLERKVDRLEKVLSTLIVYLNRELGFDAVHMLLDMLELESSATDVIATTGGEE